MLSKKIAIIGLGVMGGSLAAALKAWDPQLWIHAIDPQLTALHYAQQQQWIDSFALQIDENISACALIFLAVPLSATQAVLAALKPFLSPETILSDLGSVKQSVVADLKTSFGYVPPNFILAHPIAGSEQSGVQAAKPQLFQQRPLVITPLENTNPQALKTIIDLWQNLGALVLELTPKRHDELLALTSHLPHLLAFGFLRLLQEKTTPSDYLQVTGGGFADFTRIGRSDPVIWRDISLANRELLLVELKEYQKQLQQLETLLEQKDAAALEAFFSRH